jgi:hypothetical protein
MHQEWRQLKPARFWCTDRGVRSGLFAGRNLKIIDFEPGPTAKPSREMADKVR